MPGALKILEPGLGITIQDGGRRGWKRFGLPPGGFMDAHSASCANKLVENAAETPLLELLLQGQKIETVVSCWVACCGADANSNIAPGRAVLLRAGEVISFPQSVAGVWIYLAMAGGIQVPEVFGSASYYARGRIGPEVGKGHVLTAGSTNFLLPHGVSGRMLHWQDQRDLSRAPNIRVWPGPQFHTFTAADRERFFAAEWMVSAQSDRVGYRLKGPKIHASPAEIESEPVLVGSIQVPENGQPLITMPDGPTVGGYPKLALVHPEDLSWVAQRRPGQKLRFSLVHASGS
jgi:biotin-dependent carboxylase-like uncharacterized protein